MTFNTSWRRGARRWIAPLGLCLSILAPDGMAQPAGGPPAARSATAPAGSQAARPQRAFATPEAAVKALIEALQAPTDLPLRGILGGPVLDTVPLSERQADDRRRAAGAGWPSRPSRSRRSPAAAPRRCSARRRCRCPPCWCRPRVAGSSTRPGPSRPCASAGSA